MPDMTMPDFADCPLPDALDAMGERWSFLILRASLFGVRHFEEYQSSLGIARNILSNRLARLVAKGILSREVMACDKRRVEYLLTPKGKALAPVMLALRQWGEQWGNRCGAMAPPIVDRRDRQPIRKIAIMSHDGRELDLDDLTVLDDGAS